MTVSKVRVGIWLRDRRHLVNNWMIKSEESNVRNAKRINVAQNMALLPCVVVVTAVHTL